MLSQWKLEQHICPAKQRTKFCHLPVSSLPICLSAYFWLTVFSSFLFCFVFMVCTTLLPPKGNMCTCTMYSLGKDSKSGILKLTRLTLIRIPHELYLSIVEELHHGSRRKNLQLRWITMGNYARKGEMAHLSDSAIPCTVCLVGKKHHWFPQQGLSTQLCPW